MEKMLNNLVIYNKNNFKYLIDIESDNQNEIISNLCTFAEKYSFSGNIWHKYISFCLAFSENAFSYSCENGLIPSESIKKIALFDIREIIKIFFLDLSNFNPIFEVLENYSCQQKSVDYYEELSKKVSAFSDELAKTKNEQDFLNTIIKFYNTNGCGNLGLFNAFRVISAKDSTQITQLVPITNVDYRTFDSLIGYDFQKKQLIENTEMFLLGKAANNVLLYGDGGTGKSSSIKALLNKYAPSGLRLIQVYKNQFATMNDVIAKIKERNYKFILYLDDLSFEEFEIEFKHFKAIIEGGLETKPNNVLIYATSNRRHLIKETFSSRGEKDDIHANETIQEMVSLSSRFGLSIYYPSPSQIEYLNIVHNLAKVNNIEIDEAELDRKALQWQMRGYGLSGRSAQQFINSLN